MQSMLNFSLQVFHKKSFNWVITINRCTVSFCSNRKRRIIFRRKFFTTMTLYPSTDSGSGWWFSCGWFFNLCKRHFVCKFLHLMSLLCLVSTQNAKISCYEQSVAKFLPSTCSLEFMGQQNFFLPEGLEWVNKKPNLYYKRQIP